MTTLLWSIGSLWIGVWIGAIAGFFAAGAMAVGAKADGPPVGGADGDVVINKGRVGYRVME